MAIDYSKMSVYGDTYGTTEQDLDATQQNQETGIAEILIPNINTPYLNQGGNNEFAKIAAANNNIDYNNLIIPPFESEQESNMFTDAMGNIKSFAEKNKLLSGIMKAGSMIRDPITGAITSLLGMLPEQDPRATATKNFYDENFGLTSSGSVASGIMQGYNPVSGGLFGGETQYGLTPAIDKRIAKINQTLKKYDKYKYGSEAFDKDKYNQQIEKIKKLEEVRAKEAEVLEQVKAATAAAAKKKQQEVIRQAAYEQARKDKVTYAALEKSITSGQGGQGYDRPDSGPTSVGAGMGVDGGYSTDYGFKDGGRIGYGTGGIVSL